MKIQTIAITRKKNLGNYESVDMSVAAELKEGEGVSEAMDKLELFIDHKLNAAEREAKYEKFKLELDSDTLKEEEREPREKWIKQHLENLEKVNALDFL